VFVRVTSDHSPFEELFDLSYFVYLFICFSYHNAYLSRVSLAIPPIIRRNSPRSSVSSNFYISSTRDCSSASSFIYFRAGYFCCFATIDLFLSVDATLQYFFLWYAGRDITSSLFIASSNAYRLWCISRHSLSAEFCSSPPVVVEMVFHFHCQSNHNLFGDDKDDDDASHCFPGDHDERVRRDGLRGLCFPGDLRKLEFYHTFCTFIISKSINVDSTSFSISSSISSSSFSSSLGVQSSTCKFSFPLHESQPSLLSWISITF